MGRDYMTLYANEANCAILLFKSKDTGIGQFALSVFESTIQVLLTSSADNTHLFLELELVKVCMYLYLD